MERNMKFLLITFGVLLTVLVKNCSSRNLASETVSKHGKLSLNGTDLVDEHGEKLQLKGMSLFWDVWMPQYYNKESIHGVHELCYSNVVRAAISVVTDFDGGYIEDPEAALGRLFAVVDAAIEEDIYVIVDWHDHAADTHLNYSLEFFEIVSRKYRGVPNIIYETFNEPTTQSWGEVLKPYHEKVINTIRANDPDNIIVVGTPTWSQSVDQAAANPIENQTNIMYTLHFYAGTHKQWLRDIATQAISEGLPIFVTEYGTVNADATEPVDPEESRLWWNWLDEHNLSYVNWVIASHEIEGEGASALIEDTLPSQVCQEEYLTESGKLVVAQNKA